MDSQIDSQREEIWCCARVRFRTFDHFNSNLAEILTMQMEEAKDTINRIEELADDINTKINELRSDLEL